MKERPILFNGEMVKAILEGRKTQTRRVIKLRIHEVGKISQITVDEIGVWQGKNPMSLMSCPYGKPGDRLWVRETFAYVSCGENDKGAIKKGENGIYPIGEYDWDFYKIRYAATEDNCDWEGGWKPSIYIPRWASRINLEITDVRVERVQDISEEDAQSEGVEFEENSPSYEYSGLFAHLWNSINQKRGYGWDKNPWVWVIEFKRIENVETH